MSNTSDPLSKLPNSGRRIERELPSGEAPIPHAPALPAEAPPNPGLASAGRAKDSLELSPPAAPIGSPISTEGPSLAFAAFSALPDDLRETYLTVFDLWRRLGGTRRERAELARRLPFVAEVARYERKPILRLKALKLLSSRPCPEARALLLEILRGMPIPSLPNEAQTRIPNAGERSEALAAFVGLGADPRIDLEALNADVAALRTELAGTPLGRRLEKKLPWLAAGREALRHSIATGGFAEDAGSPERYFQEQRRLYAELREHLESHRSSIAPSVAEVLDRALSIEIPLARTPVVLAPDQMNTGDGVLIPSELWGHPLHPIQRTTTLVALAQHWRANVLHEREPRHALFVPEIGTQDRSRRALHEYAYLVVDCATLPTALGGLMPGTSTPLPDELSDRLRKEGLRATVAEVIRRLSSGASDSPILYERGAGFAREVGQFDRAREVERRIGLFPLIEPTVSPDVAPKPIVPSIELHERFAAFSEAHQVAYLSALWRVARYDVARSAQSILEARLPLLEMIAGANASASVAELAWKILSTHALPEQLPFLSRVVSGEAGLPYGRRVSAACAIARTVVAGTEPTVARELVARLGEGVASGDRADARTVVASLHAWIDAGNETLHHLIAGEHAFLRELPENYWRFWQETFDRILGVLTVLPKRPTTALSLVRKAQDQKTPLTRAPLEDGPIRPGLLSSAYWNGAAIRLHESNPGHPASEGVLTWQLVRGVVESLQPLPASRWTDIALEPDQLAESYFLRGAEAVLIHRLIAAEIDSVRSGRGDHRSREIDESLHVYEAEGREAAIRHVVQAHLDRWHTSHASQPLVSSLIEQLGRARAVETSLLEPPRGKPFVFVPETPEERELDRALAVSPQSVDWPKFKTKRNSEREGFLRMLHLVRHADSRVLADYAPLLLDIVQHSRLSGDREVALGLFFATSRPDWIPHFERVAMGGRGAHDQTPTPVERRNALFALVACANSEGAVEEVQGALGRIRGLLVDQEGREAISPELRALAATWLDDAGASPSHLVERLMIWASSQETAEICAALDGACLPLTPDEYRKEWGRLFDWSLAAIAARSPSAARQLAEMRASQLPVVVAPSALRLHRELDSDHTGRGIVLDAQLVAMAAPYDVANLLVSAYAQGWDGAAAGSPPVRWADLEVSNRDELIRRAFEREAGGLARQARVQAELLKSDLGPQTTASMKSRPQLEALLVEIATLDAAQGEAVATRRAKSQMARRELMDEHPQLLKSLNRLFELMQGAAKVHRALRTPEAAPPPPPLLRPSVAAAPKADAPVAATPAKSVVQPPLDTLPSLGASAPTPSPSPSPSEAAFERAEPSERAPGAPGPSSSPSPAAPADWLSSVNAIEAPRVSWSHRNYQEALAAVGRIMRAYSRPGQECHDPEAANGMRPPRLSWIARNRELGPQRRKLATALALYPGGYEEAFAARVQAQFKGSGPPQAEFKRSASDEDRAALFEQVVAAGLSPFLQELILLAADIAPPSASIAAPLRPKGPRSSGTSPDETGQLVEPIPTDAEIEAEGFGLIRALGKGNFALSEAVAFALNRELWHRFVRALNRAMGDRNHPLMSTQSERVHEGLMELGERQDDETWLEDVPGAGVSRLAVEIAATNAHRLEVRKSPGFVEPFPLRMDQWEASRRTSEVLRRGRTRVEEPDGPRSRPAFIVNGSGPIGSTATYLTAVRANPQVKTILVVADISEKLDWSPSASGHASHPELWLPDAEVITDRDRVIAALKAGEPADGHRRILVVERLAEASNGQNGSANGHNGSSNGRDARGNGERGHKEALVDVLETHRGRLDLLVSLRGLKLISGESANRERLAASRVVKKVETAVGHTSSLVVRDLSELLSHLHLLSEEDHRFAAGGVRQRDARQRAQTWLTCLPHLIHYPLNVALPELAARARFVAPKISVSPPLLDEIRDIYLRPTGDTRRWVDLELAAIRAKLDHLVERAEKISGKIVVVAAHVEGGTDLIAERLGKAFGEETVFHLKYGVSEAKRRKGIDAFRDPNSPVRFWVTTERLAGGITPYNPGPDAKPPYVFVLEVFPSYAKVMNAAGIARRAGHSADVTIEIPTIVFNGDDQEWHLVTENGDPLPSRDQLNWEQVSFTRNLLRGIDASAPTEAAEREMLTSYERSFGLVVKVRNPYLPDPLIAKLT